MLKIDQKSPLISVHTYSVGVQEEESVEKFMSTITDVFYYIFNKTLLHSLKVVKCEQTFPLFFVEYYSRYR